MVRREKGHIHWTGPEDSLRPAHVTMTTELRVLTKDDR